jgi:N-acyl-L-homoserine lactone synthetase
MDCGDTGYWCDYAITYTNQHKARHQPEFIAEELKRFGQYEGIEGVMAETTTGMTSMLDTLAMCLEALTVPYCVRCREAVLISAAVPIGGRT